MKCWLINSADPTPVDPGAWRQRRMGMIAEALVEQGHDVRWWSSTFVHATKTHRYETDATVELGPNYRIRFLRASAYERNISLARVRNHAVLARKFRREAERLPRPDVILASYPTIELCREAVRYGRRHGVPTALDVRDQWPDLFLDLVPWIARPVGQVALMPYYGQSRAAFRGASAVLGTSPEFVRWGLTRGRRQATDADRDFPFGYAAPQVRQHEMETARQFWREMRIGLDANVPVICFFGAMNHHFDLSPVFNAVKRIADRQRIHWVLCGDGERLAEYRRQAAAVPGVVLPGWVNGPQIWALMEVASFGLAPYVARTNFLNNVANKPIEYLAGGLPILCSHGAGALHRLVTQHACGLSYYGDASKLAAAVLDAVARPEFYAGLRQNARRLFTEKFEADRVYGDMAEHLASLATPATGRYDLRRAA